MQGIGIDEILDAIIERVPPPSDKIEEPLQCLVFDSYYDPYRGVVPIFRVVSGRIRKGDKIRFMASGKEFDIDEIGVMSPQQMPVDELFAGEVWY